MCLPELSGVEKLMATPFLLAHRKRKRTCIGLMVCLALLMMLLLGSFTPHSWFIPSSLAIHRKADAIPTYVDPTSETTPEALPQRTRLSTKLNLVMMGDSITRFQYLSLVNFLHKGTWKTQYLQDNNVWRDITRQAGFLKNWSNFHAFSNNLFEGKEVCDCFRTSPNYLPTVRENRYYADPESGIYVTYLQRFGNQATRGMLGPTQVHLDNSWLNQKATNFTWQFDSWEAALREHVAKIVPKPQYFIFNAGKWPHDLHERETLLGIRQALVENDIIGIYKTTTSSRNETSTELEPYEKMACQLFPCLRMHWTAFLPPSVYSDRVHFRSEIYRDMNVQMLGMLQTLEAGRSSLKRERLEQEGPLGQDP